MSEPTYQPALSWWEQTWRSVFAVAFGGLAWGGAFAAHQWDQQRWLFWVDPALGLLAIGLMQLRRRYPLAVALVVSVLSVFSASSSGAVVVIMTSLATRRRWREIVPVGVFGVALGQAQPFVNPGNAGRDSVWVVATTSIAFTVAILAVGLYIGSRRELLWTLRDRVERAEREQSLRVAQARTNERGRIAREMHDVLAHRISLVAMHAGALAYRTDLRPEEVQRSATVIEHAAHQALVELRDVLGVLREELPGMTTDPPQPTLADIEPLVAEACAAGARVSLQCDVADDGVPTTTGRTVYRIVQEGLTNAGKHAPAAHVGVSISGERGDGIAVRVRNPLRIGRHHAPTSGYGLIGLRERTELQGGHLSAETADAEFVLEAWLPWPA
ncbi:MAG: hypothetical protein H0T85_01730 [Geodermatophilaceae bacterium]|nr:hypothetical protein [Geodermatophilaceae bacterium]